MSLVRARTGCHTECGRRPVNQDSVLAVRLSDGRELVAVADGMGGHNAGEVASQRALEVLWDQLKAGSGLHEAVAAANAAVHAEATQNPAWNGMGTTLVAMLRTGDRYEIANVGDSRAYRVTADSAICITTDHSVSAEAAADKRVGAANTAVHARWRNALTRALGTDAEVATDMFGPYEVRESHAVVLCTDGAHRVLDDAAWCRIVGRAQDPWRAARALVAEAYDAGSSDNISAAVVLLDRAAGQRTQPVPAPTRRPARRRMKSRRARRTEIQLLITLVLLGAVLITLAMVLR